VDPNSHQVSIPIKGEPSLSDMALRGSKSTDNPYSTEFSDRAKAKSQQVTQLHEFRRQNI